MLVSRRCYDGDVHMLISCEHILCSFDAIVEWLPGWWPCRCENPWCAISTWRPRQLTFHVDMFARRIRSSGCRGMGRVHEIICRGWSGDLISGECGQAY